MSLLARAHGAAVFGRRVQVIADHLAPFLPADARVLDIGCGDGSVAAAVMERRPDVEIRGIDVLIRPTTHIPVERYDGVTVPHPDSSFDAVMFVDVLHHTDGAAAVLAEAARVSSGPIVVKDHVVQGVLARPTLRLMDWVGNAGHGVRLPYNYLSRAEWLAVLDEVGLEIVGEERSLGLYPPPASWLFDRGLHMVWALRRAVSAPSPEGSG